MKRGGESLKGAPKPSRQTNLTDPDSTLRRKSKHDSYEQACNTQALVDADGSQLIVATDVLQTPADSDQLRAGVHGMPAAAGTMHRVPVDGGCVNVDDFGGLDKE